MSTVKLYVYDLSNGLAKQLSQQLTGRQIDGIWHTSIVVFGKEVWYGQGISIAAPGTSHHGQPMQIVEIGETAIDEATWQEYLDEMRDYYTADKYHLLDFNCNSFTNDCAGFLTGESIPSFVTDLPTDFLSTPFGAALRPTIDAMYRRPGPAAPLSPSRSVPQPEAMSLLQAVAAQAQRQQQLTSSTAAAPAPTPIPQPRPLAATESLAAPLHPVSNSASFRSLLQTHKAVVAFFTDYQGCAPCRMIAPVFESLALEKGVRSGSAGRGAAFTKIDLRVGMGGSLAGEWGVRVTPTFMFFLDGKKISELKGADQAELRTQIDLLLFQAYPPHPHSSLALPAVKALSLTPILFTQSPALDAVFAKLTTLIDASPSAATAQAREVLRAQVLPYLKARFTAAASVKPTQLPSATHTMLVAWASATAVLSNALPTESLFPLVDMWRLAVLDPAVSRWLAETPNAGPIGILMSKADDALSLSIEEKGARNYVLTILRLLTNAFGNSALGRLLLAGVDRSAVIIIVPALLHVDAAVRTAAASLAFNVAASAQRHRQASGLGLGGAAQPLGKLDAADAAMAADEEWQVELTSALVEAIQRETAEEVLHRLVAALACLLRYGPVDGEVTSLAEVLGARDIVLTKSSGVQKQDVKALMQEVGTLCSTAG